MSEEVVFVFGAILGVSALAYLLLGGGGLFNVKLSAAQIAVYAMQAGFTGDDLVTAVAIALAESGGDPNNQGDFMGGQYTSYGLWQIHWTVHPEFQAANLFDPQYNANAAFLLYQRRGGFRDWSTYTVPKPDGTLPYQAFLDQAQAGVNA